MRRIAKVTMCIGFVSTLASAVFGALEPIEKVREYALPSIAGKPYRPRISGDWVVTVRNAERGAENVIAINVVTKQAYTIFDIANGASIFPSASGNLMVWTGKTDQIPSLRGKRGKNGQLNASMIIYDIAQNKYSAPELNTVSAFHCSIFGKYIAYELGSRIYLYDMTNQAQKRISSENPFNYAPHISGDLIVWTHRVNDKANRQVYAYRISTGELTRITDDDNVDYCSSQTDGRYIAWWHKTGAEVYDTVTKNKLLIPKAFFPAVDKGIVVYQRPEGRMNPVFGMEIATRKEFRISTGSANIGPDISGRRVIWCSGETIYCADLTPEVSKLNGEQAK